MEASTTGLRWFHAGFELRDRPGATGRPTRHAVELWLGATDRADAARISAEIESDWIGRTRRPRQIAHRRPLTAVVPDPRDELRPDLDAVAGRPWALVEGCLVQDVIDADVIALEWLEATGGAVAEAERALNRVHLWDLIDDDESDPAADVLAACGLARAWQRALDGVDGAERIVVELHLSTDGPELTVFRQPALGAATPATPSGLGPRMTLE